MERRRLLAEQVIKSSQDKLFCLAGFTYSQQITEKAIAAKGKKTFEEMVPKQYRDFANRGRIPAPSLTSTMGRSGTRHSPEVEDQVVPNVT